jgi:LytS/YehU family sensor histidine kinase
LLHIVSGLILGVVSASAYFVSLNARPTQRRFIIGLLLVSGGTIFTGCIFVLVYKALDLVLVYAGLQSLSVSNTPTILLPVFVVGAIVYAFSLVVYDALISVQSLRGVEQREAAKELWAKHAELKALRAQINPHFLFNSLNSISALTSLNAEKARAMVIELSQFYRESLTVSDLPLISVEREIAICKHFIAVETIRYGNKLMLDINCNPDALKYQIPPLCLQPLIENAIKHGISQLTTASPINLKVEIQRNKLYMLVDNDFTNDPSLQKPEGTQTGLENLRSRLALLYGEEAYCGWSESETRFQVELIFPLSEREL